MSANWSTPTTPEIAAKRAGGRARINAQRQHIAACRRRTIAKYLFGQGRLFQRGIKSILASKLGVSYSTICRDVDQLLKEGYPCPHCGAYMRPPLDSLDKYHDYSGDTDVEA